MLPERLAAALADPPRAYSPVPIWWWSGEALDADRLRWQLERFAEGGIHNLVVLNLAPSGPAHGCDADDPPFFSQAWWDLFIGACEDARRLGISLWFYDQLGFSGADLQAKLVARQPRYAGHRLHRAIVTGVGGLALSCPSGGRSLRAVVEAVDANGTPTGPPRPVVVHNGHVGWDAPGGPTRLSLFYETDHGFDYLSETTCHALLDQVHGEFARRLGDLLGTVVVGSFQDELPELPTWSATFAEQFAARYGYDLLDRLGALWDSTVPDADRVRRDYHALRADLAEAAFFRPLAAWHERYGLLVGCDQQDPARAGHPVESVKLYADYARTHRWFSAPGSDHHGDARIHSSLAHLYGRPRTWIEAFHSTGWGGTLEETLDWLLPWLRTGATLYNPHAVYYSTRAGWWEWAPPSTDWRQPYWRHHKQFADAVARMCAALSLGRHVCDVAVLYPNATVQADLRLDGAGPDAARAQEVYRELIGDAAWFAPVTGALDRARLDADVIDDDSLATAVVRRPVASVEGSASRSVRVSERRVRLCVAGEAYSAVVLPAATVLEEATARRLDEFVAAGGLLVAVGALPGRGVAGSGIAGDGADEVVARLRARFTAGEARYVASAADLADALADLAPRVEADVPVLAREVDGALSIFVTATPWSATVTDGRPHQRGPGHGWDSVGYDFDPDRYLRTVRVRVRQAPGVPVLASLFGGAPRPLPYTVDSDVTEVLVPFDDGPAVLLVFAGGPPPSPDNATANRWEEVTLDGDWDAELIPTLDNAWGDFAWPARAGSEPVIERWALDHRLDGDEAWRPAIATFGPHGLIEGPQGLVGATPAEYSQTRGIHKDWVHRGALGPKGHVPEEFLDFGTVRAGVAVRFRAEFTLETGVPETTVAIGAPAAKLLWLDGVQVPIADSGGHLATAPVRLAAGRHELELELTPDVELPLRAHLAFVRDETRYRRPEWITLADQPPADRRIAYGTTVHVDEPVGSAPLHLTALGAARLLVNGAEVGRQGGFAPYERPIPEVRRYDLAPALRSGANEIVVKLAGPSPILVDSLIDGADPLHRSLRSDHDWWGNVDGQKVAVRRHRRQHRDLSGLQVVRRPHPLPGAAWLDGTEAGVVLPVTFGVPRPPGTRVEWLRFDIPPGATRLDLHVHGDAELWVDGVALAKGVGPIGVDLPAGSAQGRLRVLTRSGYEAGAALAGPIRFAAGPGRLGLGDWQRNGLAEYSGGVRYRRRITTPPAGRLLLDLGRVRGTAEVRVDGRSTGVRFCTPYAFDLTGLAPPGEHLFDIEVFGTLAPYLDAVSPTHFVFEGQRVSGLFGPVRLRWSTPS